MKWTSYGIQHENHEMKKSQTMVKDIELENKAKGSIEGGEKKLLRSPHLVHLSLIGILCSSIVVIS